jgi:hypothetical protein
LRSFSAVLLAVHSAGTSRASASSSSRRERLELLARGLEGWCGVLGELGLDVGEFAEFVLPAVLEAAGDQSVLGLAGMERPLGTRGVIAGALDAQLERPI